MYSINNEEKFVFAERFIRTLKKKKKSTNDFNIKKCVY